jgi:quinol monooxygenase YgiN
LTSDLSENRNVAGPFPAVFTVYRAKLGSEQRLLTELRQLVCATRLENGCLVFDLFRVHDRAQESESDTYSLYEVWESPTAKEAHGQAFHARRFEAVVSQYLVETPQSLSLVELR